eukprot:3482789-Rhodomonas_salina.1
MGGRGARKTWQPNAEFGKLSPVRIAQYWPACSTIRLHQVITRHVAAMHCMRVGSGANGDASCHRGLQLLDAESKARDVGRRRGDSAVRPRGG